jgi:hypothetical protein
MTRKKPGHKENWTATETRKYLHDKAKKAAEKAKKQESGKKYKRVPIKNGYKLIEIKE